MTKIEIQENAVNLFKIHNNLLLDWCTGLGKSKAALDIVSQLHGNGFIVLAEKAHIKNWKKEIIKFHHEDIFERSEVFLYASLHKYKNRQIDWIIWDEVHHGLSDIRQNIISSIKCSNNILLSATIDNNQLFELTKLFPKLKRDHISLHKAISENIIPTPEINLIPIELDNTKYSEYFILLKGSRKFMMVLECKYDERWKYLNKYEDLGLKVICTQKQKYFWLEEQMEYWKDLYFKNRIPYQKNKWLQLGSERKRFLAEIKTSYAHELLYNIKKSKKRFICFTGSINQCNLLGSTSNVVHSKNKNNQEIIDSFNNGKIDSLYAVNMLQEGVNLYDIEIGIIVQLDGKLRSYVQRAGRIFRSNKPIQYIIYVKNTRDEEYLNNALENLKQYVK